MAEKEFIEKWIKKADEDFGFAAASLNEEFEYFPQICWHFQQAAEKYLKSYIIANSLEFRKIHDLSALLKTCSAKNSSFDSLSEECKHLQKYYVETRYPVVWETKWTKNDAEIARAAAQKIADFVKKLL